MTYITNTSSSVERAIFYHQSLDYDLCAGSGPADSWSPRTLTLEEHNDISSLELISYDIVSTDSAADTITVSGTDADSVLKQGRRLCVRGTSDNDVNTGDREYLYNSSSVGGGNTTISIATASVGGHLKDSISASLGAGGKVYTGLLKFTEDMDVIVTAYGLGHRSEGMTLQVAKYDGAITYSNTTGEITGHSGTVGTPGVGGWATTGTSITMSSIVSSSVSITSGDIIEVQHFNGAVYTSGGEYKTWGAGYSDSEVAGAGSVPPSLLVDVLKI